MASTDTIFNSNLKFFKMKNASNSVHLIGNIGRNPELRKLDNGRALITMNLATNDYFKDKAGKSVVKTTQWHHIVAWNKQAEHMGKVLKAGNRIAIIGKLEYCKYEDKTGKKRTRTRICVEDFQVLNRPMAEA